MDNRVEHPASFDTLVASSQIPVLADFYADWCGPCKAVSPSVKQIAREYAGRLLAVKVNTDKRPGLASRYDVTAIPTLILFHRGEPIARLQGALPLDRIRAILEEKLPCSKKPRADSTRA